MKRHAKGIDAAGDEAGLRRLRGKIPRDCPPRLGIAPRI
jgi:hypothetical protein